jgi:hypothetical protein
MIDRSPLPSAARVLTVLCAVAWIAAFTATHVPIERVLRGMEFRPSDVLLHMAGYFGLTVLLLVTLAARRWSRWRRVATVLLAVPVYGAFDELSQPLVGRTAAVSDWLGDVAGVIIAVVAVEALTACIEKRWGSTTPG